MCIWIYSSSSASLLLFLWEKQSLWCVLSAGLSWERTVGWTAFLHDISANHFGSELSQSPPDQSGYDKICSGSAFPFPKRVNCVWTCFMPITDPTKNDQCLTKDGPSSTACLLQWPVQETGQIFSNHFFVWPLSICFLETRRLSKVEAGFLENWILSIQHPWIKEPRSLWHPSQLPKNPVICSTRNSSISCVGLFWGSGWG